MPEGAVAAEFFGSGLGLCGSMEYEKTPLFGGGLTVLVDLVIPAVMLAASAYSLSNATTKADIDRLLRKNGKVAEAQLVHYLGDAHYGIVPDQKHARGRLIRPAP